MPLGEMFKNARDKFVDTMDAADRWAIGVNERAKRLKQAMFPEETQPANAPPMETTPKRWEQPSTAGEPNYQESEIKRARRSRR